MYLPLHNVSKRNYLVRITVTKLCFFTVSMPLLAFVACVLMTMYKDFANANTTHCDVPNVFPSISASIGNYEPQITVWRTAIYTHAPFRFFIIYLRGQYYYQVVRENCALVVKLAVLLNVVENMALIGLTHWTSSKYYPFHEVCFKIFVATSIVYMLLSSLILTRYRRRPNLTLSEKRSVKWKWRAFVVNVASFAFAAYFFLRHNRLCEPYVYSLFGIFEYIVVFSNIGFHLTTVYDLQIRYIYVSSKGLVLE